MFGLDANILLIVALVAVSAGAVSYALLFSRIETENKTSARISRVKSAESDLSKVKAARDRVQELSKRRKSVQDSLKDLEKKQEERSKKMGDGSLKSRLAQTGLPLTMPRFYMMSGAFGVFALVAALLAGIPLIAAAGAAFVAVIGLPRWIVAFHV